MDPKVKKVRKAISERKKSRGVSGSESDRQLFPHLQVQEEEKHGYFPIFTDSSTPTTRKNKFVSGFILKGILSSILFLGTAILFQSNNDSLEKPKAIADNLFTDEFPFAKVNQWYQQTFGTPLAFSPKGNVDVKDNTSLALPVSGSISESFQANGEGVLITPGETSDISVLREGVIIFAGSDPETGKTIVVQHADGSESTYGHLSSINVHLYQFVDNNQTIGEFVPTEESKSVYFSIQKNDEYVNPVQVIEVDDRP